MANLLVIHGPNLNLLGTREPEIYGITRLEDINKQLVALAHKANHQIETFQSNAEADLINKVHNAKTSGVDFMLINPGGLTHTSISLRDAISAVTIPFIEIHLSNIFSRETFRHHSYFSDIAVGVISGFGPNSYILALTAALDHIASIKK